MGAIATMDLSPREPLRGIEPHPKQLCAEGLRGFAAANVVLAHFFLLFVPNIMAKNYRNIVVKTHSPMEKSAFFAIVHSPPISLLYNGQFAVSLFFALSGYVIALPWHQRGIRTQDRGSLASSLSRDGRQHVKETEADAAFLRLRRRLWGRFLRLHIPAAASVLLSYCLQSMGAFRHDISTLPPEQLPWWESTLPPPNSTTFIDVLPALSGGEILFGKTALNVVLWTLKLEFWGSIVVLLYVLVVEPCPSLREGVCDYQQNLYGTAPPVTSKKSHVAVNIRLMAASLDAGSPSRTGSDVTAAVTANEDRLKHLRRTWWLRSICTVSFTFILVNSLCDAQMTLAIVGMLLAAHWPAIPRFRAAWKPWVLLVAAAYLGAFQYERQMYGWSACIHRIFGDRFEIRLLFNSAGAVLAVGAIVHNKAAASFFSSPFALFLGRVSFPVYLTHLLVLGSLGVKLYFSITPTLFGSSVISWMLVLVPYVAVSYGVASTVFLAIDRRAVSFSRSAIARII